ncbi:CRASP family complement regulator-acquiring lipoprotein (plasmid) [Borreliella garinii]|uniref:CRASP family complement regulator-acquiring lipoprotein n=1 Tax=Borreliella garinii TaxID=29519 RepID=UPI0004079E44|nr:CRASP family complement regulator-acquiring lipoprotein [Borreliella garinii]
MGSAIDDAIVSLYSKKDTLNKLEILDLENLKNSFEKLLSIRTVVSEMINQLLLDYKSNKNSIKTNNIKLEFHVYARLKQIIKKVKKKKS